MQLSLVLQRVDYLLDYADLAYYYARVRLLATIRAVVGRAERQPLELIYFQLHWPLIRILVDFGS